MIYVKYQNFKYIKKNKYANTKYNITFNLKKKKKEKEISKSIRDKIMKLKTN